MKRECLRLLADARSGDHRAQRVVAEHYLRGTAGFPKHMRLGVEYLSHPEISCTREASVVIARSLSLTELLEMDCMRHLQTAAACSDATSLLKLAAWQCVIDARGTSVWPLLQRACEVCAPQADVAMRAWSTGEAAGRSIRLLTALSDVGLAGGTSTVLLQAARLALESRDIRQAAHALQCLSSIEPMPDLAAARMLCRALGLLREIETDGTHLPSVRYVQSALELASAEGDLEAAFILGRALCWLDTGAISAESVAVELNLRRGTALLLRAADGGCTDAWIDLYRLHSRNRSSVANPGVATFCLEKAAAHGDTRAQRRMGVDALRQATSVRGFEQGIAWLHRASVQGDTRADELLATLVFPVAGADEAAEDGLRLLQRRHPSLAVRLRVARCFGLTRSEALTFCPIAGNRPWGLVVDRNPFVTQSHLSLPRAVPAITAQARQSLNEAISFFSAKAGDEGPAYEGLLRQRSLELRRTLRRLCVDDALYFARASSSAALAMKFGSKWVHRHRELVAATTSWEA